MIWLLQEPSPVSSLSFSVFLCVAGRTYWREKGWGCGRGAESYDREIACPSINHSILSGVLRIILHFPLVAIILYTKNQKYSQNDSYWRVELPLPLVSTVVWGAKLCLCKNSRIRFPNSSYLELVGVREKATEYGYMPQPVHNSPLPISTLPFSLDLH